jgi:hypothetical protein
MLIPCFRCGKEIETPNAMNADYIIADDLVAGEPVETLVALKHNSQTLAKEKSQGERNNNGNPISMDLRIMDEEYDHVEIPSFEAGEALGDGLVKIIAEFKHKQVQKTGIVCSDCHKPDDFVVWGVHKR